MAWVRLDCGFFRHHKAVRAGKDGRALFLAALCYCGDHLTDGHVPKAVIRILASEAEVKPGVAKAVTDAGLWAEEGDHYVIRDYLSFGNSSRTAVESERDRWRDSKRRSRKSPADVPPGHDEESLVESRPCPRVHDTTRHDRSADISTTDDREMLANGSSSVVEKAALVFGYAQAASSVQAIDNPAKYASGVARNVLAEQGERLRAYVAEHPSDDAEAVAANVFKLDRWALIGARKAMP